MSCAEEMRGRRVGLGNQERVVLCKVLESVVQQEVIRKANGPALSARSSLMQHSEISYETKYNDQGHYVYRIQYPIFKLSLVISFRELRDIQRHKEVDRRGSLIDFPSLTGRPEVSGYIHRTSAFRRGTYMMYHNAEKPMKNTSTRGA